MKNPYEILEQCKSMLDLIGLDYGNITSIEVNKRAKHRWGTSTMHYGGTYTITISSMLLEDGVSVEATYNTMMHELLHCHPLCRSHTGEWKRRAGLVNNKYGMNIKRTTSAEEKGIEVEEKEKIQYHIICEDCGKVYKRKRWSKSLKAITSCNARGIDCGYRCVKCGSHKLIVATVGDRQILTAVRNTRYAV